LVIHGGGISTIIVKNVQLTLGTTTTALTAASTATTNTTTVTAPSLNTVSIGTLIPRAATTFTAHVATTAASPLPAGALVAFYQTLGGSGEVPYVIEASPIDPFNQVLFNPQVLSTGTVDSGTYVASGETVTVVSAAPVLGAGKYLVAGTAPNYADGPLTPFVVPPSSGTNPVKVTVPGLSLGTGTSAGSVTAVITPATPGKYNQGRLLISHEGALVASAALDSVLAQGGSVSATVPVGTAASYYYVSVRVWNSSTPSGTLSRQWYPSIVDLRSSASGSIPLTIN
jgi:hypothetical protein